MPPTAARRLFLGVDGGGTKTRARVRDETGRSLGEAAAGPGNQHLGEGAWAEVMRAAREALAAAGIGEADFGRVHAGFGLAGTQPRADHDAAVRRPHPFASLAIDTDAYAAYLGAWGGADGAILILGTGSCGLAVVNGRRTTIGGWGHAIGDDASGMAIGRLAVRRSLWVLEGMAERTALADEILRAFAESAENAAAWAATARPADYATFAPSVFDHAGRGDPMARDIVAGAARDATMLIDRLIALRAPKVAMVGGVFPRLLPWLPERVRPSLVAPAADAMDGAILMAGGVVPRV
jgi:glucosamine kinase